jgi:hypothetical protein
VDSSLWIAVAAAGAALLLPILTVFGVSLFAIFGSKESSDRAFWLLRFLVDSKVDPKDSDQAEQIVEGYLRRHPSDERTAEQ